MWDVSEPSTTTWIMVVEKYDNESCGTRNQEWLYCRRSARICNPILDQYKFMPASPRRLWRAFTSWNCSARRIGSTVLLALTRESPVTGGRYKRLYIFVNLVNSTRENFEMEGICRINYTQGLKLLKIKIFRYI
jgi:hypothetical protein